VLGQRKLQKRGLFQIRPARLGYLAVNPSSQAIVVVPAEGKTMFSRFTRSIRIVTAKTQIKKVIQFGRTLPLSLETAKTRFVRAPTAGERNRGPRAFLFGAQGQNEVYPVRARLYLSLEMAKNEVYPGEAARLA
jgi:hypothetical protein